MSKTSYIHNMKTKFNFSDKAIESIITPQKSAKKSIFTDKTQRGLVLVVGYGGTKAFYFRCKTKHRKIMFKIGTFPYMNVENARNKAFLIRKDIKNGDYNAQLREFCDGIPTLSELFYDKYLPNYAKVFKKQTSWRENERIFKIHFGDLQNLKINELDRLTIDNWHKKIGKNNGIYVANRCLALIRHMLNMAIDWGLITINNATHIKQYKEIARDRFLQPHEIGAFMTALKESKNAQLRQFILLLLFTGQRKSNILALRWENINFYNNILYLPDTKNNQPQQIPLTEQAINVLKGIGVRDKGWVFPSQESKSGHLENPKKFWQKLLKKAGIENLRMHDLRRTLGSYQAIIGSSMSIIGKSLGHKSVQSTAVYARLSLTPVRESMQKATDEILKY